MAILNYLEKTLMEGEELLYQTRLHEVTLFPAFLWIILSLIWESFLRFYIPFLGLRFMEYPLFHMLTWIFLGISFFVGVTAFIAMKSSVYALTSKRVIMKTGLFRRFAFEILLHKVEGLRINQSAIGRFLGYGCITICGTGGSQDAFYQVKSPLVFRNWVQKEIELHVKPTEE